MTARKLVIISALISFIGVFLCIATIDVNVLLTGFVMTISLFSAWFSKEVNDKCGCGLWP